MERAHPCRPLVLVVSFAVIACVFFWSGACSAVDFSADLFMEEKGDQKITGKIFVQGDKIRQEIVEEGEKQVMIFRPDKGVIWLITPDEEMYMEMPYQADNKRFEKWSPERESNARFLGNETVSGLACKKYEIQDDGEKTFFWVSDMIPFPVKVQYRNGVREYKSIKENALSDSLFDVPAEYTKIVMPVVPNEDLSDAGALPQAAVPRNAEAAPVKSETTGARSKEAGGARR